MTNITIILTAFLLLGCASSRPVRYDQRQDGDINIHAHLEDFFILFIPTHDGFKAAKEVPEEDNALQVKDKATEANEAAVTNSPIEDQENQDEDASPKTEFTTESLALSEPTTSKDTLDDEEENSKDSPPKEQGTSTELGDNSESDKHNLKTSENVSSNSKPTETKDSDANSSKRDGPHTKPSEETVAGAVYEGATPEDSVNQSAQAERTARKAWFIDLSQVDGEEIAKLRHILSGGVEP